MIPPSDNVQKLLSLSESLETTNTTKKEIEKASSIQEDKRPVKIFLRSVHDPRAFVINRNTPPITRFFDALTSPGQKLYNLEKNLKELKKMAQEAAQGVANECTDEQKVKLKTFFEAVEEMKEHAVKSLRSHEKEPLVGKFKKTKAERLNNISFKQEIEALTKRPTSSQDNPPAHSATPTAFSDLPSQFELPNEEESDDVKANPSFTSASPPVVQEQDIGVNPPSVITLGQASDGSADSTRASHRAEQEEQQHIEDTSSLAMPVNRFVPDDTPEDVPNDLQESDLEEDVVLPLRQPSQTELPPMVESSDTEDDAGDASGDERTGQKDQQAMQDSPTSSFADTPFTPEPVTPAYGELHASTLPVIELPQQPEPLSRTSSGDTEEDISKTNLVSPPKVKSEDASLEKDALVQQVKEIATELRKRSFDVLKSVETTPKEEQKVDLPIIKAVHSNLREACVVLRVKIENDADWKDEGQKNNALQHLKDSISSIDSTIKLIDKILDSFEAVKTEETETATPAEPAGYFSGLRGKIRWVRDVSNFIISGKANSIAVSLLSTKSLSPQTIALTLAAPFVVSLAEVAVDKAGKYVLPEKMSETSQFLVDSIKQITSVILSMYAIEMVPGAIAYMTSTTPNTAINFSNQTPIDQPLHTNLTSIAATPMPTSQISSNLTQSFLSDKSHTIPPLPSEVFPEAFPSRELSPPNFAAQTVVDLPPDITDDMVRTNITQPTNRTLPTPTTQTLTAFKETTNSVKEVSGGFFSSFWEAFAEPTRTGPYQLPGVDENTK